MTPEVKLALVTGLAGLLAVGVAYARWRLRVTKREDWQREMREAAADLAAAKTPEERAVIEAVIEDLKRDARADDKEPLQ